MSEYRRLYRQQGWYFFTGVTYNREKILIQPDNLVRRRQSFRCVMKKLPFKMDTVVILPDHIHCIWRLPPDDDDFPTRWKPIMRYFSTGMNAPLTSRSEKKVWQRRFWEHLLRNEKDWQVHMDYIHYNPVKHGYVQSPGGWPYGSFRRAVKQGLYPADWEAKEPSNISGMNLE
jgi:putative transposase